MKKFIDAMHLWAQKDISYDFSFAKHDIVLSDGEGFAEGLYRSIKIIDRSAASKEIEEAIKEWIRSDEAGNDGSAYKEMELLMTVTALIYATNTAENFQEALLSTKFNNLDIEWQQRLISHCIWMVETWCLSDYVRKPSKSTKKAIITLLEWFCSKNIDGYDAVACLASMDYINNDITHFVELIEKRLPTNDTLDKIIKREQNHPKYKKKITDILDDKKRKLLVTQMLSTFYQKDNAAINQY